VQPVNRCQQRPKLTKAAAMGISDKKTKKATKSHERLSLIQATRVIDKNSRSIVKICQLLETKKQNKEINPQYDKEGFISRRIEKLKSRVNRRLVKLAKWVDHPEHEQLAGYPMRTYSNRVTNPLAPNSYPSQGSKSRSRSIPLPKFPSNLQQQQGMMNRPPQPPRPMSYNPQAPHRYPPTSATSSPAYRGSGVPRSTPPGFLTQQYPVGVGGPNRTPHQVPPLRPLPPQIPRGMLPPRPPFSAPRPSSSSLLSNAPPPGTTALTHLRNLQKQTAQNIAEALKSSPNSPSPNP
jgi:hypothetical protein